MLGTGAIFHQTLYLVVDRTFGFGSGSREHLDSAEHKFLKKCLKVGINIFNTRCIYFPVFFQSSQVSKLSSDSVIFLDSDSVESKTIDLVDY